MESNNAPFQVGDTVICISSSNIVTGLVKGNKYEVLAMVKETCGKGWHVGFRKHSGNGQVMPCACGCHDLPAYGFVYAFDHRFRKIQTQYTDITKEIADSVGITEEVPDVKKIKELETSN